jgi:hypothetical protein
MRRRSRAIPNNGEVIIPRWLVDLLPERLWAPGNLIIPRYGDALIGQWHFCVGPGDNGQDSVRTVERNGRQVARGRRTFNFNVHDTHA